MPRDYQKEFAEAVKAVRNRENSRKENYPDDEAVSQVKEYLREKFIARVGLGLGNETANVDAELANTFAWAVDQYILNQLRDA